MANIQQHQNQLEHTHATPREPLLHPSGPFFISGVPDIGWFQHKKIFDDMLSKKRVGGTLDAKSVAQGTAAGNPHAVGPAPAAAVLATFTAASLQTYGEIKIMTDPKSSLYETLSNAPFDNDAVLSYAYINHFMQLAPRQEDISVSRRI